MSLPSLPPQRALQNIVLHLERTKTIFAGVPGTGSTGTGAEPKESKAWSTRSEPMMTIRYAEDGSGSGLALTEAIAWKFVCGRHVAARILSLSDSVRRGLPSLPDRPYSRSPFRALLRPTATALPASCELQLDAIFTVRFSVNPQFGDQFRCGTNLPRERKLRNDAYQPQIQCIRNLPRCGLRCTGFSANTHPFRFDTLKLRLITGAFSDRKQNDIQCAAHL